VSRGRSKVNSTDPPTDGSVTTRTVALGVADAVARLTELIQAKGMRLFAVIDQAAEAAKVGLQLRPTTLVIFGNPAAGTAVMDAVPLSALDLPLKLLFWSDGQQTKVSYLSPAAFATRYHLAPELARNVEGIDHLAEALVSP
jgi:uncharacterized protein (DUF302 family)